MHLPPGFRMEVVAAEPMIAHPVAMAFDADGRMWVVEMRSYMPDALGRGEDQPSGRISVLEDTDGNGTADKSTVFLDNLVLPRAISIVRDGVLVGVPPNLLYYRDANHDLKPDGEPTILANDYGIGKWNPEHQPNGLIHTLDNWIYSADYPRRIRQGTGDQWTLDTVQEFGQWGISQDNFGRLYHDSNSDHLRMSLVPPHYPGRNPHKPATGANIQVAADQTVWPAHYSAINRGYRENVLRPDGTLRNFTAACGPVIYRGGIFPEGYEFSAFVGEVSANVVRHAAITTNPNGTLSATNPHGQGEFIASTYERFRPVNCYTGPDGALYIVDMHHGLIQHKNFLTTYARAHYLARQLDKHLMTGRIYRIVPESKPLFERPALSAMKSKQLVELLAHPNGWWRDMAQQLIVERNDYRVAGDLRKLATTSLNPLARLHALWTLEGIRQQDPKTLAKALADTDPNIRAAAIRVAEPLLNSIRRTEVIGDVLKLAGDRDPNVMLQFALTVSALGTPETDTAVAAIAFDAPNDYVRDAIVSGLRGRELVFLEHLLDSPAWQGEREGGRAVMISALAQCIIVEGTPKRVDQLLQLIESQSAMLSWRRLAMLDGFPEVPKDAKARKPRPIFLDTESTALAALQAMKDDAVASRMPRVEQIIHWPGQPGYTPPPPPTPLTEAELARFEAGKNVYSLTCMPCHKVDGLGQAGLAPPLIDSEWVLGPIGRPIRIITHGVGGALNVSGNTWNLEMPALPTMIDEDIAAVLTYVRREWGHTAGAVDVETVKRVRAESASKLGAYTERELLQTQ